ncbi:MAG: hypothetical protein ABW133_24920 [Polyangiaceae bacterium]
MTLTCGGIAATGCLDRPVAPTQPGVTARVVERVKQNKVSKIDLLFMIDNSSSMADKQAILSSAVPELVNRLIEPRCVNQMTGEVLGPPVDNQCAMGVLDFEPIKDIHIGIISSSLGSHGANNICNDGSEKNDTDRKYPHNNDRGHLISRTETDGTVPTFNNKGFLRYKPGDTGALATVDQVVAPFKTMVTGVGQQGCGYEASLESVYRFLIDPEPFQTQTVDSSGGGEGRTILNGVDQELLAQRAAFLRPDSLVSVMIVTDENDCSIDDLGQGFYPLLTSATGASKVRRGTSACLTNPNDTCCFNCGIIDAPPGCPSAATDSECKKDLESSTIKQAVDDPSNLRCFNQKKKYGASFLYPVQRYIDGFTKRQIATRSGKVVDNPLYADLTCKPGTQCSGARTEDLVFVAGITGVPWQLIANNENDLRAGYKSTKKLHEEDAWAKLIGDPYRASGPVLPSDPHMIESITPRSTLAGPGSAATADKIHGHEWDTSKAESPSGDLQYACTFKLPVPKPCAADGRDCDCNGSPADLAGRQNPLCQTESNTFTNQQQRAKAYPGTRILEVLKGLNPDQAIVASICPANVEDSTRSDYGYTPAIQALLARLRTVLRGRCLPRPLEVDPDNGTVKCVVVEAYRSGGTCDCKKSPGRREAEKGIVTADMHEVGDCFCEIEQLEGADQEACKTNIDPGAVKGNGWCYVDPMHTKTGEPDARQCNIVSKCEATERRLIKFANPPSEPIPSATAFIMCQEKAFDPSVGRNDTDMDVCKK